MFLSMNNCNYMSKKNRFKDIGTFLSKKLVYAKSRDQKWFTPIMLKCSVRKFCGFFWYKLEVYIFKRERSIDSPINYTFYEVI